MIWPRGTILNLHVIVSYQTINYLSGTFIFRHDVIFSFLVLEHVSGGELFDYLVKRGRLPLGEVHDMTPDNNVYYI